MKKEDLPDPSTITGFGMANAHFFLARARVLFETPKTLSREIERFVNSLEPNCTVVIKEELRVILGTIIPHYMLMLHLACKRDLENEGKSKETPNNN